MSRPLVQFTLVMAALILTTLGAIRAALTGENLLLAFVAMPLAFFAAGFWLAESLLQRGARRAAAFSAMTILIIGVVATLLSEFDPNRWRALILYVGMLTTVPTLLLGMAVGGWRALRRAPS